MSTVLTDVPSQIFIAFYSIPAISLSQSQDAGKIKYINAIRLNLRNQDDIES